MDKFDVQIFRDIVEHALDAIIVIDAQGLVVFWNDAAEALFGYTRKEVRGRYIHNFLPVPELRKKAHQAFLSYQKHATGPLIGELVHVQAASKSGGVLDVQLSLNILCSGGQQYVYAFLRDISDLIEYQNQLSHLSETDELTGLLNRRAFNKAFESGHFSAKKQQSPLSLLYFDLDHFKSINDGYGHIVGDSVLEVFSNRVNGLIRAGDHFGRLGGEEFALLLLKCDIRNASRIAERIREAVSDIQIWLENGECLSFTVSIGVTELVEADLTIEPLYRRADKALYAAKTSGRNCVRARLRAG